jgi:hypothetical protein
MSIFQTFQTFQTLHWHLADCFPIRELPDGPEDTKIRILTCQESGEARNLPRDSRRVRSLRQSCIHECLWHKTTGLRIISQLDNLFFALTSPLSSSPKQSITESMDGERTRRKPIYLRSIDVHTRRQINVNSDCARQVELTVQCASPMSTRHSSRRN